MAKSKIKAQHYRSSVKGRKPAATDMDYGELAINYNHEDPSIIIKGDDNTLIEFNPDRPHFIGEVDPTQPMAAAIKPLIKKGAIIQNKMRCRWRPFALRLEFAESSLHQKRPYRLDVVLLRRH